MRVYIATDHAGFELKKVLVKFMQDDGHDVIDMGAHALVPGDDYPKYILPCAENVAKDTAVGSYVLGIILGGSGQGEAMAANRVKGVRAAVYYGSVATPERDAFEIVRLPRQHNDANILSIGARFVTIEEAKEAVRVFLKTPFSGDERHVRRLGEF